MATKNNAKLPDISTLLAAGIDPKTGLPIRMADDPAVLKQGIKSILERIDEQDALNRFTWYNLPDGLDGKLIERILYYKGQGMFFYMESTDTFLFLPYALAGTIDVYGRYLEVTPVPFGNGNTSVDGKVKPWINGLKRKPIYDIMTEVEWTDWQNKCILLHDYSKGLSETVTPRCELNRQLIDVESDMIPFMRTALVASTGVTGMRVNSEDEQSNVKAASRAAERSALTGERWIPIVGQVEFQDLATGTVSQANDFMLAMNSLDNLRLSTYGLDNGGMFEKQGTILQSEANAAGINTGLILNDGLTIRQNFCHMVNSLFGLGIWCEITQPATFQPAMDKGVRVDDSETSSTTNTSNGANSDNNNNNASSGGNR